MLVALLLLFPKEDVEHTEELVVFVPHSSRRVRGLQQWLPLRTVCVCHCADL